MNTFKQSLLAALGLIALILLAACSPQTLDLQRIERDAIDTRITFYYQGDKVIKAKATTTTLYKATSISNAEEAKEMYDNPPENPGFTYKYEFQKDRYIETTEVDFEKALQDKSNTIFQEVLTKDGKSVSLEKTKNKHIELGFEVIKNKKFQELPKP